MIGFLHRLTNTHCWSDPMIPIKNPFKLFFHRLKSGRLAIDELSLFLILISFVAAIFLIFLSFNQFILFTWIPILIAYWRSFSKNKARRSRENQIFTKRYYPIASFFKNTLRRITFKKDHVYFSCKKCKQQLRIPKKTGHIKVTCPKCSYSFIKKTIRGYVSKLKRVK